MMMMIIIIIIASWEFPLMSNAPILNVFHILQLWTSHVCVSVCSLCTSCLWTLTFDGVMSSPAVLCVCGVLCAF